MVFFLLPGLIGFGLFAFTQTKPAPEGGQRGFPSGFRARPPEE